MSADVIEKALEILTSRYIFPEKAAEAADAIRARVRDGAYDGLDEPELCDVVTADLQAVCADKHLRFRVRAGDVHDLMTEPELEAAWIEQQRLNNYGIASVERLPEM